MRRPPDSKGYLSSFVAFEENGSTNRTDGQYVVWPSFRQGLLRAQKPSVQGLTGIVTKRPPSYTVQGFGLTEFECQEALCFEKGSIRRRAMKRAHRMTGI